MTEQSSDATLLERLRQRDRGAPTAILSRWRDAVFGVCGRWPLTPENAHIAAEDAFIRLFQLNIPTRASLPVLLFQQVLLACAARPTATAGVDPVGTALLTLPAELRIAVLLRDIAGLSSPQVAAVLNVPLTTAKSRIHRGRIELLSGLSG